VDNSFPQALEVSTEISHAEYATVLRHAPVWHFWWDRARTTVAPARAVGPGRARISA
jgi:hypothetical protein